VRHPRQACHYYAKGHTTCKKNPRRESLDCSLPVAPLVFTNITYSSSPFTRKIYMYIKYHTTKTFRNSSYNFSHQQEKIFSQELEFHKRERKSMQNTSLSVENVFKYSSSIASYATNYSWLRFYSERDLALEKWDLSHEKDVWSFPKYYCIN